MINSTDSYVVSWRCWYNNNEPTVTEYNSIQHTLYDLPSDGFQAMRLWYSNGGGRYITGNDHFYFATHPLGTIYGQSNESVESIQSRYNEVIIKLGKTVPDNLSQQIENLMINSTNPLL